MDESAGASWWWLRRRSFIAKIKKGVVPCLSLRKIFVYLFEAQICSEQVSQVTWSRSLGYLGVNEIAHSRDVPSFEGDEYALCRDDGLF